MILELISMSVYS